MSINNIWGTKTNIKNNNLYTNVISQKNLFCENISKILENKNFKIEEIIERFLKMRSVKFLKDNKFWFLRKYMNEEWKVEEKFYEKFDKYFPIHEEIFFKNLNEEIDNLEEINEENVKNTINNFLSKYLHIIFIFTEKIKLSDLDKYLKSNIEDLSFTFSWAKTDIILLDNFWKDIVEKLKKRFWEEEINDSDIFYMSEKFFSSLYRRLYKEIEESKDNEIDKSKWDIISEKIEEEFKKAFNEVFYIFETWIEYWYEDNEKLKNLEIFTRKLFEWLVFIKKENIAFRDFPVRRIDEKFVDYIKKFFLDFDKLKSDFKEEFILFLKYVSENNFNWIKPELREKIKEKEEKIANSRVPNETERINNLNINNVDFQTWENVEEAQKYENVFSEVIARDWKMNFAEFLELKNKEKFEEYFEIFSKFYAKKYVKKDKNKSNQEHQKEEDLFKENMKKQFEEILKYEWKKVEDFIKNDVNNLNALILWWRFILKIRSLKKDNQEINLENISKIEEKEYWVVEKILKRLKRRDLLDTEKIRFSIDWKVRNTSIEWKDLWLDELIKSLKRWFIDLGSKKIKLADGEEKIIWWIKELYIPAKLNEDWQRNLYRDISAIETHLDDWIDVCYALLKNRNINESSTEFHYLKNILITKKIVPENYKDLKIEDKERLQELVEMLKFIRSRISPLKEMMLIWMEDRNELEKDQTIKELLRKHKDSSIWPEKAFKRAFEKLIWEYGWNFNKIWDLTRARVVSRDLDTSIEDIVNFIDIISKKDIITNISIVDSTWEPISIPKKNSWYRDIKLFLKLKSWNTVEVQFQVEEMYEIKDKWINLELEENNGIFVKMWKEWALLTNDEMKELLNYCKERSIELPTKDILIKLMKDEDNWIEWENFEEILKWNQISTDYSYHIARQLEKWSSIRKKLTRLERILADSAWSKIVLKYLENKNVKID